jgi:hypothetical protein
MMTILCRLSLFQERDMDTLPNYISPQSIEMFNITERSYGCKEMVYPAASSSLVETYHFNFVSRFYNMNDELALSMALGYYLILFFSKWMVLSIVTKRLNHHTVIKESVAGKKLHHCHYLPDFILLNPALISIL